MLGTNLMFFPADWRTSQTKTDSEYQDGVGAG